MAWDAETLILNRGGEDLGRAGSAFPGKAESGQFPAYFCQGFDLMTCTLGGHGGGSSEGILFHQGQEKQLCREERWKQRRREQGQGRGEAAPGPRLTTGLAAPPMPSELKLPSSA